MKFTLLATTQLPLQAQLHWLWYSDQTNSFITGDDRKAFALPISAPSTATPLQSARPFENRIPPPHPCNLPIPDSLYNEFAATPWHGFQFLDPASYELPLGVGPPPDGDILRTFLFGPDYGTLVTHPATGAILSLRSRYMEILQRSAHDLTSKGKTRPRGKAALAFAAHPTLPILVYGDNYGDFHAHRFISTSSKAAKKIAAKQRKASRIEFVQNGSLLLIGGMGYLSAFTYAKDNFTERHSIELPVRDFISNPDASLILVNQGLHGVTAYRYDHAGFSKIGSVEPQGAVQQIAVSKCLRYMAVSMQDSTAVSIYAISAD